MLVPCEDVMQEYRDGRSETFIPSIKKYISPQKLMQENHI